MNKKMIVLMASLLLTGCANSGEQLTVDTTRAEADAVEFNYVKKLVDSDNLRYECIVPQEITGDLMQEAVSFDEKIRNSGNVEAVQAVDGRNGIGIYQLTIKQAGERNYRHLSLDPADGGSVYFSGEIGETALEGYVTIGDDLREDFHSLTQDLDAIIASASVEIRNN